MLDQQYYQPPTFRSGGPLDEGKAMIFRLLTRWFLNRRREIFKYWDGTQYRRIDPLAAYERMFRHPTAMPDRDWTLADEARLELEKLTPADLAHHKRKWAAHRRTAELARFMFDLKPLGQNDGMTDDEAVSILGSFLYYLGDLKKKRDPPPKPQPPTETVCSGTSTTPSESDSCSTPNESNDDAPPS